ncbi:hypothetical protein Godav_017991 [Gossypium davidsonii]|uniref:C2H2-type domain-containing protein n=1 Tax=Gossypium davidsonii TaxID=34287 RepID=A0A7J8QV06_GOSDV|nr:hypothetical protein [Gossypium davidsonii]
MATPNESPKDKPSSKQMICENESNTTEKNDEGDNVGGGVESVDGQNMSIDDADETGIDDPTGQGSSSIKRGSTTDVAIQIGSGSGSGSNARKKREMEIPRGEPTCYVCSKNFTSWKAVFGHLKSHQRETPGALPPPTFTPTEGSPENNNDDETNPREQLAPTLLNLALETMQKMSEDSNMSVVAGEEASSSGKGRGKGRGRGRGRRGLDIDLNQPKTSFLLDLNEPPPPEQDDDDDDDDDNDDDNDDDDDDGAAAADDEDDKN